MNWGFTVKDQKIGTPKRTYSTAPKANRMQPKICKLNGKQHRQLKWQTTQEICKLDGKQHRSRPNCTSGAV